MKGEREKIAAVKGRFYFKTKYAATLPRPTPGRSFFAAVLKCRCPLRRPPRTHIEHDPDGYPGADALTGPQMCVAVRFRVDLEVDPCGRGIHSAHPRSPVTALHGIGRKAVS